MSPRLATWIFSLQQLNLQNEPNGACPVHGSEYYDWALIIPDAFQDGGYHEVSSGAFT